MISLVGRLHQGEVQQHSLHSQLLQSKSQAEKLSRELQEAGQLRQRVEILKDELGMMVPRGQFEAICKDFEASLKREKELKIYLSQHVSVVEQLQTKLQLTCQEVQCKETMLTKSNKASNDQTHSVLHRLICPTSVSTKIFRGQLMHDVTYFWCALITKLAHLIAVLDSTVFNLAPRSD
jgi:hypothetical protein